MQVSNSTTQINLSWQASENEDAKFEAISEQISNIWVGIDKDICVGAVFTWIVNGCNFQDITDVSVQKVFEKFQNAYSLNRGPSDIDTSYLPLSILQHYNLKEHPTQDFPLKGKSHQEVAALIVDQWNFLNGQNSPIMIILSHPDQTHAYGINKSNSGHFQLFDVRLSRHFVAGSLEDFMLGIEAHFTGSTIVLQKGDGRIPTDSFKEIQFIGY